MPRDDGGVLDRLAANGVPPGADTDVSPAISDDA